MTFEIILAEQTRPPVNIPALMGLLAFFGFGMYWFGRFDEKFGITKKVKDDASRK